MGKARLEFISLAPEFLLLDGVADWNRPGGDQHLTLTPLPPPPQPQGFPGLDWQPLEDVRLAY